MIFQGVHKQITSQKIINNNGNNLRNTIYENMVFIII